MTANHSCYDIVIIGAGMVGASLACALNHAAERFAVKILLIEAVATPAEAASKADIQPSYDARTTALSYGSCLIYQQIGLWKALSANTTEINKVHVSDRGHFGAVRLDQRKLNVDALGYVVENRQLGLVLNAAVAQAQAIEFLCPASIVNIKPRAQGMQLEIAVASGEDVVQINTALVVLAEGGKSPVSKQLGIQSKVVNYKQGALVCNLSFDKPHGNVAYERFTQNGPIAILPLEKQNAHHRGALIWTLPAQQAETMVKRSEADFLMALQQNFGFRLGRFSQVGKRHCYPLSLQAAQEQIRPGIVLLGNVAHTLHPVAGQGFNLALRDVMALADTLTSAMEQGSDLGSMQVLRKFLQQQSGDQETTIGFSHYINRLFSNNKLALIWARKFGMVSIDLIPVLKQRFARQTMGLRDRVS